MVSSTQRKGTRSSTTAAAAPACRRSCTPRRPNLNQVRRLPSSRPVDCSRSPTHQGGPGRKPRGSCTLGSRASARRKRSAAPSASAASSHHAHDRAPASSPLCPALAAPVRSAQPPAVAQRDARPAGVPLTGQLHPGRRRPACSGGGGDDGGGAPAATRLPPRGPWAYGSSMRRKKLGQPQRQQRWMQR